MSASDVPVNGASARPRGRTLAGRAFECYLYGYRRTWRGSIFSTFLVPLVYLGAMGFGVGALVDRPGSTAALGGLSYLEFLAPGLLAASVVLIVVGECTWPVVSQVKWEKSFYAMLATPLDATDVVLGNLAWVGVRAAMTAVAYFVAMAVFGVIHTPWAALAIPVAVLSGLSIATPVYAFAISREDEKSFSLLFRFGNVPLFLFSGTFFPISQLPDPVQPIAYLSPLWHSIDLCRALVAGQPVAGMAALHIAYLAAWTIAGFLLARRLFIRRLVV
ncbi:MAG: ABC transporter permease [Streptosporangiales bacterium]